MDEDGHENGNGHDAGDDVQTCGKGAALLAQISDEQRSKGAGKAPGREHEAVDGPDVLGTEIVGSEGRHGAEAAAVAHQNYESDEGEETGRGKAGHDPEEDHLEEIHDDEGPTAREGVRYPGPEDAADAVADSGDAHHAGGRDRCDFGDFLEDRGFL